MGYYKNQVLSAQYGGGSQLWQPMFEDAHAKAEYMRQVKARAAQLGVSIKQFIDVSMVQDGNVSPRVRAMRKVYMDWIEDTLDLEFEDYFDTRIMRYSMGVDDD